MKVKTYRRRLPHIHMPGHMLFLTFRLAPSQTEMLSESERYALLAHLQKMTPGRVTAFVVMPDHVHLLYQMGEVEDMVKTLKALKGSSSRTIHSAFGRQPPIWQEGTYDHIVRTEAELLETWQYIEYNPVRKGLVTAAGDYPWSSAGGMDTPAVARTLLSAKDKDEGGQECPPHGEKACGPNIPVVARIPLRGIGTLVREGEL